MAFLDWSQISASFHSSHISIYQTFSVEIGISVEVCSVYVLSQG